jgi:hypothetical protein
VKNILSIIFIGLLAVNCQLLKANEKNFRIIHVSGQVIDSTDASPLAFATIRIKGRNIAMQTKENGYFEIDVPYDTCTLEVTYIGYKTKEIKLNPNMLNSTLTIRLSKENERLAEVLVVQEKEKIIRLSSDEISSIKISPKLIEKLPNLGEVDVMRSFQLLPGISGTNESSSGLYVRGGTPDQNLILFDGMTIYHVDHFFGFFSAFNANTIDDIELMKGGFPAAYGGRLSSVMDITGKPADMEHIKGGGGISLLSANAYLEVPVIKDKVSLQIAARRSYSDIIQTGLYNKIFDMYNKTTTTVSTVPTGSFGGFGGRRSFQQQNVTPTFHFYDLNSKITYKPSSKDEIFISLYNGEDKLDQSQSISSEFSRNGSQGGLKNLTNWGNTGISAQWLRKWSDNFDSHLFISYSNYFNLTDREYNSGGTGTQLSTSQAFDNANLSNNIKDLTFRFKNEWKIGNRNQVDFGTEITQYDIKYTGQRTDTLTVNGKAILYSFYVQDNVEITKTLHFLAGYRGSYFAGTSGFYSEPRASLIYNLSKEISLKAAVGKYYQFVSCVTQEDILEGNKEYWLLDNKTDVPVSWAFHYIAGATYEKGNYLFNVEAYYKSLDNVLEESQRTTRNFLAPVNTDNIYSGTGIEKGIEFLAQKKIGNTTGWLSYTLGSVIYNFPDLNYGKSFYADQDQTHEVKAIVNRTIKRWDFAATFVYATGKPYTAPENLYQLTMLDGTTNTYYHLNEKNGDRLPPYSRLDLAATYNWDTRSAKMHISASIFNLLNHQNIWYKEFNPQGYQLNITNVNYLGFTPNISFAIDFK